MFDTATSGRRRYLSTTIAAGALASFAAGLALTTAGTASADIATPEQLYTINGSDSIKVSIRCPGNAPYLKSRNYSDRYVPYGIEVIEGATGVNVSIVNVYKNAVGSAVGAYGTATNWDPTKPQDVIIKAHCTSIRAEGYGR